MFDKDFIKTTKNLLAFSGGVDSTALFFLLLEQNIPFDICIVNYHQREQSKLEVMYAKELAFKYHKKCFIAECLVDTFSEKAARDFRYEFFLKIITEHNYKSLITAHQLGDKFEWFLMQLSKGAGVAELIGIQKAETREKYLLYRPLLDVSKDELLDYLHTNKIQYFIDESNTDTKYKRNFFRKEFSDTFVKLYKDGLVNSFKYIQKDIDSLSKNFERFEFEALVILKFDTFDENVIIRAVDKELKKRGILISKKTRDVILTQKSLVISHKIALEITKNSVWIAPFIITEMDKKFKEKCRIEKIPKYIRPYLYNFYKQDKIPNFIL